MAEPKVGGEVDSFCTKCKLILAHTVIAVWAGEIKRVRCNTCMGEHAYRRAEPGSSAKIGPLTNGKSPKAKAPPKTSEKKHNVSNYEELIAHKNRATARQYGIRERYAEGDLIQHPSFGLGIVMAVRETEKIDVLFSNASKTLLHNKGAAPTFSSRPVQ